MSTLSPAPPGDQGRVASLHLHPAAPGTPLTTVGAVEVLEDKGILGEPRYFGRVHKDTGKPNRRQVSLIGREEISGHAAALGLETIPAGAVRANIETQGIHLLDWLGWEVQVGDAVLHFYQARTPCQKMDAICQGLRARMENSRQGVMAEVVKAGRIRVEDAIRPLRRAPGAAGGGGAGGEAR